jgi:hypothetical protein
LARPKGLLLGILVGVRLVLKNFRLKRVKKIKKILVWAGEKIKNIHLDEFW